MQGGAQILLLLFQPLPPHALNVPTPFDCTISLTHVRAPLAASTTSDAGRVSRLALAAIGNIALMRSTPSAIVFLVPPMAWMVMVWK